MTEENQGVKYVMGPGVQVMAYCEKCGAQYSAKSGCWTRKGNHLVHECGVSPSAPDTATTRRGENAGTGNNFQQPTSNNQHPTSNFQRGMKPRGLRGRRIRGIEKTHEIE